ncbi:MAG: TonB-dependent receptor domain-containing protein [Ignavibacteria bacterium]
MKFLILFLCSILIIGFTSLYAQNSGKIIGKVLDSKNGKPVEADVKLFTSSDSTFVSGSRCDTSGNFAIEKIAPGTYKLEVSMADYAALFVDKIKISEGQTLSFDTLKLKQQNVTTEEILVEEDKSMVEFTADKKIFNVSQSALTKGGTAIDVLKKVPMVDVDMNDNVSLRGSQNVKILVDDKPSRFTSLKQIPADAIEKVEIITNPPAKYESEGVTGLINLVMKKTDKTGFTGNASLGGNYANKFGGWGGLDLNLKKSKWTVFSGIYSGTWHNLFNSNANIEYYTPPSSLVNSANGKNHGYWFWGQGSVERELSVGKAIGLEANMGTGEWFNNDNSVNNNLDALGELTSYYTQANSREGMWRNISGTIYFNDKIGDKGRELSGEISFTNNKNNNNFSLLKQDYDFNSVPANNTPLDQRDTTIPKSYNVNAQLDYVHPLSDIMKLETGYKGTFRINDNEFSSDTLDYSINNYVENLATKNHFKLNEYINAAYGVFSGTLGKSTSFKLGLRAEQTNTEGNLITNGIVFTQDYFDIFPTVNISQKVMGVHQVQLSYSRRITRPNIWRLNPFVNKINARYMYVGNPALKPEYTDSYELSFMVYTNLITVTPMLFYRKNNDVISNFSFLVDTNVTVTTYVNASGSKAYGMDFLVSSRALGWLSINGTLSMYNTKFDEGLITDYAQEEGFSWKANIRSTLTFPELFSLEFYYTYTGKKINAQGINIPTSSFDVGINKSFFKDALSVNLRISDLLETQKWGQEINTSSYKSVITNDWSARMLSLNLSYRFGNTDEYYQKKKKTRQNTNEGTDQQDSNQGR